MRLPTVLALGTRPRGDAEAMAPIGVAQRGQRVGERGRRGRIVEDALDLMRNREGLRTVLSVA